VFGEEQHRALCLAFSPEGKLLAAGCKDGTIRWWETATGRELRPLGDSQNSVLCLAFSPDGKSLAAGNGNTSILVWDVGRQVEQPMPALTLTKQELESLWTDLARPNAPVAHRAMWVLVRAPEQTVPFLQASLRPVAVDGQQISKLITELDSAKFSVRRKATQELEMVGKFAETALRQALETKPSLEVRKRIERLLVRVEGDRCVPYADELRAGRALRVLTRIDTPEARQLLKALAQGAPESWLTQEAKATLSRQRALGQRR
jgi:WD domain, G-beta repeat